MLSKFNSIAAPNEEILICYFCDSLKPSIWAQIDEQNRGRDTWKEVIKKTIDAEAKVAYQP